MFNVDHSLVFVKNGKTKFPIETVLFSSDIMAVENYLAKEKRKFKILYDPSMPSWFKHYFSTVKNR